MAANQLQPDRLVIGIDGGGTKTLAWLVRAASDLPLTPAGQGTGGPSNPRAVGPARACQGIEQAVGRAFADAGQPRRTVAAACLALAGTGLPEMRQQIAQWCTQTQLARRVDVVHDALAVLRAGTARGAGIALIAGTGSLAYGQDEQGREARAGGWGFVFGDEGSGFAVGTAALRTVTQAADGRQPPTRLTTALLQELNLQRPAELIAALCAATPPRQRIASLAPVVATVAREGDQAARTILQQAAVDLAQLVGAVVTRLALTAGHYELSLAGGLLTGCTALQHPLVEKLQAAGREPARVHLVRHPVAGAARLARALAEEEREAGERGGGVMG